jgi:dUTP pyrophosphatase
VIDSGYRGEVTAKFASRFSMTRPCKFIDKLKMLFETKKSFKVTNYSELNSSSCFENINYNVGDRVAQMVILPYPKVEFNEVDELSETERGKNGYGSTGK